MENNIERRYYPLGENGSEIRVVREEGEPTKIVGYFAKFNRWSNMLCGFFREKIEPGFFNKALRDSDPVDLFNHDSNYIMGRVSSGTLRVWENDIGLAYECTPPDTRLIKETVLIPIERGDVKGCSFGFYVDRNGDEWIEEEDETFSRILKADGCRELLDGSQVVFPAYPDTNVALRSMDKWKEKRSKEKEEKERIEQEIREKKALKIISFKRKKLELNAKIIL